MIDRVALDGGTMYNDEGAVLDIEFGYAST